MSKLKAPKAPKDNLIVSETGAVCYKDIMKKFSDAHKEVCRTDNVKERPYFTRPLTDLTTGSKHEGGYDEMGFSGNGAYEFPNGTIYEGEFQDGQFHGTGSLRYKNGVQICGKFNKGNMIEKKVIFEDGLEYNDTDWKYCQHDDRRYTVEYEEGLQPAGESLITHEQPSREIPPGYYDTGFGFYDSKTHMIYKYTDLNSIVKDTTKELCDWITKKCRKPEDGTIGPRPDLYEKWMEPELELPYVPPPAALTRFADEELEDDEEEDEEYDFDDMESSHWRHSRRSTIGMKFKARLFYKLNKEHTPSTTAHEITFMN